MVADTKVIYKKMHSIEVLKVTMYKNRLRCSEPRGRKARSLQAFSVARFCRNSNKRLTCCRTDTETPELCRFGRNRKFLTFRPKVHSKCIFPKCSEKIENFPNLKL